MLTIRHALQILVCLFAISACTLLELEKQSEQLEDIASISGTIETSGVKKPVYVVLLKQYDTHLEVLNQTILDNSKHYEFDLLPGNYIVGAYIDENKNQLRDKSEKLVFYSQGTNIFQNIHLVADQHYIVDIFSVDKAVNPNGTDNIKIRLPKVKANIGKVVSLTDKMFAQENSSLGLWQPLTFLDKFGGGLFMLQAYELDKTPVIFVHGALGNPTEFNQIIQTLDRDRYQPWVLYYPSGIQLDLVSDYFLSSLKQMKTEYDFVDIHLITHSMGGLMSRSFLMKHQQEQAKFNVSLYMTINSPLYGMDSARLGVKSSPIVIASWRDLVTDSDYIRRVHRWHMPDETAYHLVFSYLPGEEGDGVVPMNSQLSLSLQDEATKTYGFEAQHAQILKQEEFVQRFHKILAEHYEKLVLNKAE